MTEALLQKLEEKMMLLLSEVEDLRNEVANLRQENASLCADKDNHAKKVQDILGLLETVNEPVQKMADQPAANQENRAPVSPVYIQSVTPADSSDKEYAQSS